jgi:hypothetical protein
VGEQGEGIAAGAGEDGDFAALAVDAALDAVAAEFAAALATSPACR